LVDINKRLSQVTLEHLQAQRVQQTGHQDPSSPATISPTTLKITEGMSKLAALSQEKCDLQKALAASMKSMSNAAESSANSEKCLPNLSFEVNSCV